MLQLIICLFIRIISDAANDYSDNMSETVEMVEVKTDSNESGKLYYVCKNTNMVYKHSTNDKFTSESNNHSLINFLLCFPYG